MNEKIEPINSVETDEFTAITEGNKRPDRFLSLVGGEEIKYLVQNIKCCKMYHVTWPNCKIRKCP